MSSSFSKNILLTIQYDGTSLTGWQDNKSNRSVEQKLKKAIHKILETEPKLQAVSRTDAGVHALDQKVNFTLTKNIPIENLPRAINTHLPKDIRVISAEEKPVSFHPTLDCQSKEYWYFLCLNTHQLPFFRKTSWHVYHNLNIDQMRQAALCLLGEHDFSSFCTLLKYRNYENHICRIDKIEIELLGKERLKIKVQGNRFLYRMVRAIVGNLVAVGKGEMEAIDLLAILKSKDRKRAALTAPAHGLFLAKASYL